ncbi:hypothetical protein AVEN_164633-1, partial [Araneus ventricosus]
AGIVSKMAGSQTTLKGSDAEPTPPNIEQKRDGRGHRR